MSQSALFQSSAGILPAVFSEVRFHHARPAFGDNLRATLSANLARFKRRSAPTDGRHLAAVAVVVVPDARERAAVVLTMRAADLRRHGGQWACPGGRHFEQPRFAWS